ncbi:DNA polymerase III subunit alpha, partial [Buchnera aphidicola]|nr:DNA polymerase III subunit alpha [Buchnera aphidicola]
IDQSLPLVATNDVCFLNQEDFKIHKIRIAIHEGCLLKNSILINNYSDQQFLKTEEDMCHLFSDIPEALINTVEIAKRCNVFIHSGKYFLPNFLQEKNSIKNYLVTRSIAGMKIRLN